MQKKYLIHQTDFLELDSTNNWAKEHYQNFPPNSVTCITAKRQTAGRGRLEKKWVSPEGNIYTTLCFKAQKSALLPHFGQLLSISTVKTLIALEIPAMIKWPNDVFIEGKKVGGILTETTSIGQNEWVVFAGLGLNLNMDDKALATIDQPATSLQKVTGKSWRIPKVLKLILINFVEDLEKLENEGFGAFFTFYNEHLAGKGQEVVCSSGTETIKGTCVGITKEGLLQIKKPGGEMTTVANGHLELVGNSSPA